MIGNGGGEGDTERGVYALAAMDLFEQAAASTEITVAYFELYKGQLYDLLEERRQLELLEDSKGAVTVVGLSHSPKLTSVDQLLHIISAVVITQKQYYILIPHILTCVRLHSDSVDIFYE